MCFLRTREIRLRAPEAGFSFLNAVRARLLAESGKGHAVSGFAASSGRLTELQLEHRVFHKRVESMEKHVAHNLGVAPVPAHQEYYRGYLIEIAGGGSSWWFTAAPRRPDLPLLGARKSTEYSSGIEALEQAIRHINRLLRN